MKGRDKRKFGRYPCRLRVQYSGPLHLKDHYITNIGGGGVFVETFYPMEIGAPVDLEILMRPDSAPVRILGEVVWIKDSSEGSTSGMGIQFQEMSAEDRQRLDSILSEG
jgi:uncharacterized protein (TIGR02266 family)